VVLLFQFVLLKRIDLSFGSFNYIHILIYPLLILFLPLKTPRVVLLLTALAIGLTVDFFYDSPGVHASALLFMAFMRKYVLRILEPVEGYNIDQNLSVKRMGFTWLLGYVAILLFLHLCWYFSVEAFSFVYLKEILLRIISSFVASFVIIVLFLFVYNPKD